MTSIPSVNSVSPNRSFSNADSLNDLDVDSFLKLMIAELQNQDPLNPLDNKDMLAQINQIREIGATDHLTETLDSVLLGQNIASATNLIGAEVDALSDDDQRVAGVVERVTIDSGEPKLHVMLPVKATAFAEGGDLEAGKYSYRIVWKDSQGKRYGIELSGANAIETTGTANKDTAIQLTNLPVTKGAAKEIYRTDHSGQGVYQLVGVIANGGQGTFVDRLADDKRFAAQETGDFQRAANVSRQYKVSMKNISEIRPAS